MVFKRYNVCTEGVVWGSGEGKFEGTLIIRMQHHGTGRELSGFGIDRNIVRDS